MLPLWIADSSGTSRGKAALISAVGASKSGLTSTNQMGLPSGDGVMNSRSSGAQLLQTGLQASFFAALGLVEHHQICKDRLNADS